VITGAIRRAKLQSNRHHQQIDTPAFLQARCPSCHPTNSVRVLKEKNTFVCTDNAKTCSQLRYTPKENKKTYD